MPISKPAAAPDKTYTDFIQPFLIDRSTIRGRLVRVDKSLNNILAAHHYPLPVSLHMAEQIVLAALLSATLSGDGILTVQAKGDGPVRFMVVDVMAGGVIRGYAQVDEEKLAKAIDENAAGTIGQVLGKGHLAVTYDEGEPMQRYQGIVELEGENFQQVFEGYFRQSQQTQIMLHVKVSPPDKYHKKWRAGGIIIERVAAEGGKEIEFTPEEQEELWTRTGMFMRTLKDTEMLDAQVTPQNLLYRLFNEDGVWVTKLQPLKNGCRCSRERVSAVLSTLSESELLESLEDDKLTVHCQFCNKREAFKGAQINRLFAKKRALLEKPARKRAATVKAVLAKKRPKSSAKKPE